MRISTLLVVFLSGLTMATGQETRSTIGGRVTDQMSATVGGAKVLVTHLDTNSTVALTTNETGYYEAPLLIPGNYQVQVKAEGFKAVTRDGIALQVGQQLAIDVKLELGSVTETVQVTAEAPILDTSSVEAGALIDNQQLMDLPVMGNNPTLAGQTDARNAGRRREQLPGTATRSRAGQPTTTRRASAATNGRSTECRTTAVRGRLRICRIQTPSPSSASTQRASTFRRAAARAQALSR